jgi:phage head maturation protease
MSVATTVGSGVPTLNDAGELVVAGTFSSLPRAQEVRTLVKEGHIRTTSVAFMTEERSQKDGKSRRSASSSTARSWRSRRTVRRW